MTKKETHNKLISIRRELITQINKMVNIQKRNNFLIMKESNAEHFLREALTNINFALQELQ